MNSESAIFERLKLAGHRLTVGRRAVVRELTACGEPVTALDLHARLVKKGVEANKTTVYRELAFLTEVGVLRELQLGERVRRYELLSDRHTHHLVCTGCRKIEEVELANDLDSLEQRVRSQTTFEVKSHSLEFYGLCGRCK